MHSGLLAKGLDALIDIVHMNMGTSRKDSTKLVWSCEHEGLCNDRSRADETENLIG